MQSYRSELGGVAAGLAVPGTLSRSGLINIAATTFLCDNEYAVLSTNRPLTDSIFHHIGGDLDLVSTIKYLQENWCRGLDITYEWAKGHADDLNRELNQAERLNVIADEQCDVVWQQASGPPSARSSAGLWDSETYALLIRGSKITSHIKERLTPQLLDVDLRAYLEKKELWSAQQFESIDWTNYSSVFKRLLNGRQTAVAKETHNLWHTGNRHQQYFREAKACCMCNCETEDWRHVLTCGSIDASLHRAVSWGKLIKSMERWHLPQDFWTTIEKGVNHYTERPHNQTKKSKENEPQKPFGVTLNTPRNLLQQGFRTQSHISWDNFLKGRIRRDWLTYVCHNKEHSNSHGVMWVLIVFRRNTTIDNDNQSGWVLYRCVPKFLGTQMSL
jgi:hypothetical protein